MVSYAILTRLSEALACGVKRVDRSDLFTQQPQGHWRDQLCFLGDSLETWGYRQRCVSELRTSGHHPVCGYQVRVSLSSKSVPSPNYRDLFLLLEGKERMGRHSPNIQFVSEICVLQSTFKCEVSWNKKLIAVCCVPSAWGLRHNPSTSTAHRDLQDGIGVGSAPHLSRMASLGLPSTVK